MFITIQVYYNVVIVYVIDFLQIATSQFIKVVCVCVVIFTFGNFPHYHIPPQY